ncbi:MAG: hypothetical protein CME34_19495 [Gordonia sp.]|uniref:hypothetical protein n=1 Tax=Gordonia sp. (in: high G+C Gram-positive bacteria) TaxID=84139 RepID=UPI000C48255D|nr:hypothetical protein [Gordonia sp. (in: high G+C Gram-positive bacteria)]MAU84009.1 hypothetical protein [Gordonia sp. (in: high G+C Gram-positive bacteria)]
MSDGPDGIGGRLLNVCIAVFVSVMALYGAVYILREIWVPLCITLATVGVVGGGGALAYRHFRDW